jgi:methylenetetrahydrofolate dehydrogenase (NADP+)/methenyltetrahydrofolate cyclohydrolase
MIIDGEKIAQEVRSKLKKKVADLISHGVTPKIAIVTLGDESSWQVYVKRKIKIADELGIKAVLFDLQDADEEKLLKLIHELEGDPKFHGIIVQRPLPSYIEKQHVIEAISPAKDIDGFHPESKFEVPVWLAVKKILLSVFGGQLSEESLPVISQSDSKPINREQINWNLKTENGKLITDLKFVVLGKGETAGGPIAKGLKKMGIEPVIIDSKTKKITQILNTADVIISATGKSRVVKASKIKRGVVLIGVGTRGEDGILKGDYDEAEIKKIAKAYTPTPHGVGPINLSFLFQNLVQAAQMQLV